MLKKKDTYCIAVVGATGVVGRELVEILAERNFPVGELRLFASEASAGERLDFNGRSVTIRTVAQDSFGGADIVFLSAGAARSLELAPHAVRSGAVVIDNTSAFSREPLVPLVVPEVNAEALKGHSGIVANPSDAAIGLAVVLQPIHAAATIKRVVVTTFQSVSGSGKKAIDELAGQTVALLNFRDVESRVYPHQIAFNCLPHIDAFLDNGSTTEEVNMVQETKKILGDDSLGVTATAVRVPVFRCHAEAVNIETEKPLSANEVRALLSSAAGVLVYDDPKKNLYPLPVDTAGKDAVYVGRIREDESLRNGMNLWLVLDDVRKGAALNAVQIAECLIN